MQKLAVMPFPRVAISLITGRGELGWEYPRKAFWVSWSTWEAAAIVDCEAPKGLFNFGLFLLYCSAEKLS